MKHTTHLDKHLIHSIDQLIIDTACYQPVELLLHLNLLAYADYEQWRMGKIAHLSDILGRNTEEIIDKLNDAAIYAQSLDLLPEPVIMHPWGQSNSTQILSLCPDNSPFFSSLTKQYLRKDDNEQMDLFFDNQSLCIVKELKQALISRNIQAASQQFQALYQTEPEHEFFQPAKLLLDALVNALEEEPVTDISAEMHYLLNDLTPLAQKSLSGQERDYMSLFWRRLANYIDDSLYNEKTESMHSSFCFQQIPDWQAVINSINNTTDGQNYPELLARLALALNKSAQHQAFIQTVCQFFWRFPATLDNTADMTFITSDTALKKIWYAFLDQELDKQWGIQNFPGWLLLKEPGISHYIKSTEQTPEAFMHLQQIILTELKEGQQAIALRKQLNQSHPELLEFYLKSIKLK